LTINPNNPKDDELDRSESITACYLVPEINFQTSEFYGTLERSEMLLKDADRLGVFRKRLNPERQKILDDIEDDTIWLSHKSYLYIPTYEERKDLRMKGLGESKLYAAIARNGIVEVKHECPFDGDLLSLITRLLRYTTPSEHDKTRYSLSVARKFITSVVGSLNQINQTTLATRVSRTSGEWEVSLKGHLSRIDKIQINQQPSRERQRYIVIKLDRVRCGKCKHVVPPSRIGPASDLTAAIVEGHLEYPHGTARSAVLPTANAAIAKNHATLKGELFTMDYERALIYNTPKTVLHAGNMADDDDTYWTCIIRGFQHFLAVKTAVHLLENWTIKASNSIPELFRVFDKFEPVKTSQLDSIASEKMVHVLAEQLKQFARYVPPVREVSVAASAFRRSSVVEKFHELGVSIFHFPDILRNIQQNIDEVNGFLQFFEQRIRNEKANHLTYYLTILGLLLGGLAALLSAPSYVDTFQRMCSSSNLDLIPCLANSAFRPYGTIFLGALFMYILTVNLLYETLPVSTIGRGGFRWNWFLVFIALFVLAIWCTLPLLYGLTLEHPSGNEVPPV